LRWAAKASKPWSHSAWEKYLGRVRVRVRARAGARARARARVSMVRVSRVGISRVRVRVRVRVRGRVGAAWEKYGGGCTATQRYPG
jgi:hypothetical protein